MLSLGAPTKCQVLCYTFHVLGTYAYMLIPHDFAAIQDCPLGWGWAEWVFSRGQDLQPAFLTNLPLP